VTHITRDGMEGVAQRQRCEEMAKENQASRTFDATRIGVGKRVEAFGEKNTIVQCEDSAIVMIE
jgi:hypothetical protein